MSDIKIFLASSIVELIHDRDAIGNYIRRVNDALRDHGSDLYVRLFLCEHENAAISALTRKQEEFNQQIREADLFVTLYFNHAGSYTLEELDVAIQSQKPEILAFFRTEDDAEQRYQPDPSLQNARKRLREHRIPIREYRCVDQVKAELMTALEKYLPANGWCAARV